MIVSLANALKWIQEHKGTNFTVRFKKKDGSIRTMRCKTGYDDGTLVKNPLKVGMKPAEGLVKVYDTDEQAYRSFREDSLLSIDINDGQGAMDIEESRITSSDQLK